MRFGENIARVRRVRLQLDAQPAYHPFDIIGRIAVARPSDSLEQLPCGDDPARVAGQLGEH